MEYTAENLQKFFDTLMNFIKKILETVKTFVNKIDDNSSTLEAFDELLADDETTGE